MGYEHIEEQFGWKTWALLAALCCRPCQVHFTWLTNDFLLTCLIIITSSYKLNLDLFMSNSCNLDCFETLNTRMGCNCYNLR